MPKPDWNAKQNPGEKSKDHGKRDHDHGPHEHGQGALREPGNEPKQAPDDLTLVEPEEGEPLAGGPLDPPPAIFDILHRPPVQDQGLSSKCVAYADAYDQNQHDKPETGQFWNFDESKFFQQIGGTSAGAFLTKGLARRRDYGYPEALNVSGQDGNPNYTRHKIAGYTQIALNVTAIKAALRLGHGVLFIGDWYHSWHHPLASGKLPAPDYVTGGHCTWHYGWNDALGFHLRNTWGTDWGVNGNAYMPYAFLSRMYAAYRTTDK